MITNAKSRRAWNDQVVKTIASVDAATGQIDFGSTNPLPDGFDPEVDPDTASEVAWLSRSVVFEAEGDGPSNGNSGPLHGGHLMVFHTPNVAQRE